MYWAGGFESPSSNFFRLEKMVHKCKIFLLSGSPTTKKFLNFLAKIVQKAIIMSLRSEMRSILVGFVKIFLF